MRWLKTLFKNRKLKQKGLNNLALWYYEVKNIDSKKAEKIKKLINRRVKGNERIND